MVGKPYSDDLRERVALFVLSGATVRDAADAFRVSVSSLALQAELASRGVKVSYGAIWYFVHAGI